MNYENHKSHTNKIKCINFVSIHAKISFWFLVTFFYKNVKRKNDLTAYVMVSVDFLIRCLG